MNLQPFFLWCNETAIGEYTRSTTWAFLLIETIHILALAVLLGGILLVDLRLLGVTLDQFTPAKLQKELNRYINWSLVAIIVSGIPLFCSEADKSYDNDAFRPKIVLLLLAILFHYTVHKRIALNDSHGVSAKAVAILSLFLWFGVGAAGRAIGFV